MSTNPNYRQQNLDGRGGGGLDAILAKTTGYDTQVQRQEQQQQRDYYRGLTADSPPVNQSLGAVVSLEKTDLMFVFLAIQTVLMFAMWLELR